MGAILILCGAAYWHSQGPVDAREGPLVLEIPSIIAPANPNTWAYKNYVFTPIAQLAIRARILSKERYFFDQPAPISPIDLALGWRGMSNNTYLDQLKISQGSRWYHFEMKEESLPAAMISQESKNVHIVPSRPAVWKTIRSARQGQIIRAQGSLVNVTGPNAFRWKSYHTIGGSGEGSCWIFWVDEFIIEE